MADKPKQSKPSKRRVKNPETFRERALKASEGKPAKATKTAAKSRTKPARRAHLPKPVAKVFSAIGKVIVPVYLRNSWRELKLVTWPSWKQSRQLTFAVLVFAIVFGALVAVVDYGLDKVFRNILLK